MQYTFKRHVTEEEKRLRALKRLKILRRRVASKQFGSNNYFKALEKLTKYERKVKRKYNIS